MQTLTDQIIFALKEHGPMTARQTALKIGQNVRRTSSTFSKIEKRRGYIYHLSDLPPKSEDNPHNGPAKVYDLTRLGHKKADGIKEEPPAAPEQTKPPEPEPTKPLEPAPKPEKKVKKISRAERELQSIKAEIASRERLTKSEKTLLANVAEKEPVQPWEFDPATDPVVKTLKRVTISFGKNRLFTEGREHAGRLRYFAGRMEVVAANPNQKTGVRVEAANTAEWLRDTANLIDELTETAA